MIFQNCLKLRITISRYHSWYLCQISLQIMLLPIQMALNTKDSEDLYGNSGNRFEKIIGILIIYALPYLLGVFLLPVWLFPDQLRFKRFPLSRFSTISGNSRLNRGTQRPNVSKYARNVSDGFLCALEACLVNLELP